MLQDKYFQRLGFSREEAEKVTKPSKENLDKIMEAHLARITFDNLSQHGLPHTASLAVEKTAKKILDEKRGGFCFELNGLLSELLLELGYSVKRIPAIVHAGDVGGFRRMPTHLVLVVSNPQNQEEELFVDVGFGEPPINSIKYELGVEQETPEGMLSRLVKCSDDPEAVVLEWKLGEEWLPRLKWPFEHPGKALHLFQEGLDATLDDGSIFHQKLIVCKIDRKEKISLAGSRLKITSPRFGPNSQATVEDLGSIEEVHKVLEERFNVPKAKDLDLEKSKAAKPEVWAQM